jgi:hypothetical protein
MRSTPSSLAKANAHLVAVAVDLDDLGIRFEVELALERPARVAPERRVAERPDVSQPPEQRDVDVEPMQRLPELEADDAGTEDRNRARQIVPVEDVVVDDEAIAGPAQAAAVSRGKSRWR